MESGQTPDPSRANAQGSTEESPEYPEGGGRAWLSVLGSLCGMMCCFGLMNTIGTFQAFLIRNQLRSYSTADVGWIFGVYLFVAYFSGIQTGPLFDAQGPRYLTAAGSLCLVSAMLLLGICRGLYSSHLLADSHSFLLFLENSIRFVHQDRKQRVIITSTVSLRSSTFLY